MDILITGLLMMGFGYWAAHIRLTAERLKVLRILTEARDILVQLEADRSSVGGKKPGETDWVGP